MHASLHGPPVPDGGTAGVTAAEGGSGRACFPPLEDPCQLFRAAVFLFTEEGFIYSNLALGLRIAKRVLF